MIILYAFVAVLLCENVVVADGFGGDTGINLSHVTAHKYAKLGKHRSAISNQKYALPKPVEGGFMDENGRFVKVTTSKSGTKQLHQVTRGRGIFGSTYESKRDYLHDNGNSKIQTTVKRHGYPLLGGHFSARADYSSKNQGVRAAAAFGYNDLVGIGDEAFKATFGTKALQGHTGSLAKKGDLGVHAMRVEFAAGRVASAMGAIKTKNAQFAINAKATHGLELRALGGGGFSPKDRNFQASVGLDGFLGARATSSVTNSYRGVGSMSFGRIGYGLGAEASGKVISLSLCACESFHLRF